MPQRKLSLEEITSIVNELKFWDREFRLTSIGDGWNLQVIYDEEDVDTGTVERQHSRKWYISPYSTKTEVVETAYAACLRSMKHVVREHFTYKGRRVMSPHFDIEARVHLCDSARYDVRED